MKTRSETYTHMEAQRILWAGIAIGLWIAVVITIAGRLL